MSKEYGLILSKNKLSAPTVQRPAIFDEDSDSDGQSSKPTGLKKPLKRQDRVVQEKALEEDPTVFQYDELYDDMDQKRNETKLANKDLDRQPKYIKRLLVAAERRKLENERRIERQVQKEREAEGDEFRDKEAFVTASYKKKLQEMKELEEKEAREEYLESIGDCTKQVDGLDGFYRHLYSQVNEDKKEGAAKEAPAAVKVEKEEEKKSKRRYRKREDSKSEDEEDIKGATKAHLQSNVDADSDFSIDSESEGEKEDVKEVKVEAEAEVKAEDAKEEVAAKKEEEEEQVVEPEKPKKPKINIWQKRTVGVVFDEALKRYYERKTLRESG